MSMGNERCGHGDRTVDDIIELPFGGMFMLVLHTMLLLEFRMVKLITK